MQSAAPRAVRILLRVTSRLAGFAVVLGCAQKPVKPEPSPVDQRSVQDVGKQHNHEVLKCYQERLKAKPNIQGDVTLWIDLDHSGQMENLTSFSDVDHEFTTCVRELVHDWKFDWAQKEGGGLEYHFHVHPDAEGNPLSEFSVQPYHDRFNAYATIRHHRDQLKECGAHVKTGSKMMVEFTIGEKGEVTAPKVSESIRADVDACVMKHLKSWTFPLPPKDMIAKVRYPFFF